MKKYRLKAQYKIMLYLITLYILISAMIQYNNNILIITLYYIIAYNMIKTAYESIKKEDNRTAKIGKSSNK